MKNRRKFIKEIAGAGLGFLTINDLSVKPVQPAHTSSGKIEEICVFSKHLQFLDYDEMAETAAEIGFDGVDLTVRPGGHVLPENVVTDLPRAVNAVKKAGLKVPMMATGINNAADPNTRMVLDTAAKNDIRHYRMEYFKYDFEKGIIESLETHQADFNRLIQLNKDYKIIGNYQNHDGVNVGASVWDLYRLLEMDGPEWIGCQFDIRHATVEGAHSWPVDLQLISPYIHTLVIKDFKWGLVKGKWEIINTPIGEGMVDFSRFFQLVKKLKIGGPVSMHFEYPMFNDSLKESEKKQVISKMKRDLNSLKALLKQAELL